MSRGAYSRQFTGAHRDRALEVGCCDVHMLERRWAVRDIRPPKREEGTMTHERLDEMRHHFFCESDSCERQSARRSHDGLEWPPSLISSARTTVQQKFGGQILNHLLDPQTATLKYITVQSLSSTSETLYELLRGLGLGQSARFARRQRWLAQTRRTLKVHASRNPPAKI